MYDFFRYTIDLNEKYHIYMENELGISVEFRLIEVSDMYLDFDNIRYGHLYYIKDYWIESKLGGVSLVKNFVGSDEYYDLLDKVNNDAEQGLRKSQTHSMLKDLVVSIEPNGCSVQDWLPYFHGASRVVGDRFERVGVPMLCGYLFDGYYIEDDLIDRIGSYF